MKKIILITILLLAISVHSQHYVIPLSGYIKINNVDSAGRKQGQWLETSIGGGELLLDYAFTNIGIYVDDKKCGIWKRIDSVGNITAIGFYKNGNPDGEYKIYYLNGNLYQLQNYYDGVPNGTWYQYREDGTLSLKESYEMGYYQGEVSSYYENGQVAELKYYIHGIQNGPYLVYSSNGALIEEVTYKDGFRIGEWKQFYSNGKLSYFVKKDDFGKKIGVEQEFYETGSIKKETPYLNGVINGDQKWYNINGDVIKIVKYENGLKIDTQTLK